MGYVYDCSVQGDFAGSWRANAVEFRKIGVHSCAGTQRDIFLQFLSVADFFPKHTYLFPSLIEAEWKGWRR